MLLFKNCWYFSQVYSATPFCHCQAQEAQQRGHQHHQDLLRRSGAPHNTN